MFARLPLLALALLIPTGALADQPPRLGARPFVSPSGKVYRSAGDSQGLVETWFREADTDGDGALGYEEFRADFARAFAEFDTDRDGEIEPEEVTHYETVILPEMVLSGASARRMARRPTAGREGTGLRRGSYVGMAGAGRFGLIPISHPIWDADGDFNRGVSRAEFERAAARRFNLLDTGRDGRLALADLIALREPE
jgi:EF hand domain-containing protein